ncbi:MAG: hypothetical protein IPI81_15475 [Flavobacteriales bacterium]|nr:hypothetical protein [Flavobacteriales bacterium]
MIALLCAPFAGYGQTLGAGNQFSVFLCAPAGLSAAGSDYYGQLGNYASGDQNVAVPVDLTDEVTMVSVQQQQAIVLGADGTVWTWGFRLGTSDVYDSIPYHVPGLSNVTQVAMGFAHAAALRVDSTVWIWAVASSASWATGRWGRARWPWHPYRCRVFQGSSPSPPGATIPSPCWPMAASVRGA